MAAIVFDSIRDRLQSERLNQTHLFAAKGDFWSIFSSALEAIIGEMQEDLERITCPKDLTSNLVMKLSLYVPTQYSFHLHT